MAEITKGTLIRARKNLASAKACETPKPPEERVGTLIKKDQVVMFLDGPHTVAGLPDMLKYIRVLHKDAVYVIELTKRCQFPTGWGSEPCGLEDLFEVANDQD